jgi:hypothetical protein
MGGGLFASAAKNTVPGATAPKATSGFGSSTATPVVSLPVASTNTTPAVTPVSAPVAPSSSAPSVTPAATEPPKEKRATDEGMAKQFEAAYFTVSEDLDKVKFQTKKKSWYLLFCFLVERILQQGFFNDESKYHELGTQVSK